MPPFGLLTGFIAGCTLGAIATYMFFDRGSDNGRYQILPSLDFNVWRIDSRTGEVWLCSYNRGDPTCNSLPKPISPNEAIDFKVFDPK